MKYPENEKTAQEGVNYIATQVNEMCCIWRELTQHDVGIDGHIEIVKSNKATGKWIAIQSKSGESYIKNERNDHFDYYTDIEHINYWSKHSLPVVIVIYSPLNKVGYWIDFKQYLKEHKEIWNPPHKISFPKNIFSKETKINLMEIVEIHTPIIDKVAHDTLEIPFFSFSEYEGIKDYPLIPIEISDPDGKNQLNVTFLIDTGADISVLPKSIADALNLQLYTKRKISIKDMSGIHEVNLSTVKMRFSDFEFMNVPVILMDRDDGICLLGRDPIMQKFLICFDIKNKKVLLRKN